MKKCSKCGDTKPLSEFNKKAGSKDGHRSHCRVCQSAANKIWSDANQGRRAITRKAWNEANLERKAATTKAWRKANLDKMATYTKAWKLRNPYKGIVHDIVQVAVANGTLVRQPCEVCGALEVHGHHDDYSQPLAVRWLCHKHHNKHHAQQRRSQATFYSYPVSYALDPTPFYAYPENYSGLR